MNRHEQVIHVDMNWNDEQTIEEQNTRNEVAREKAETIATLLHDPSKGVHTEAYMTMTGWAVLVAHNVITIGQADLKRECVERGYEWHRNCVTAGPSIEKWLKNHGMGAGEAQRLVMEARQKNPDVIVHR